jgi:hypothetical protein
MRDAREVIGETDIPMLVQPYTHLSQKLAFRTKPFRFFGEPLLPATSALCCFFLASAAALALPSASNGNIVLLESGEDGL